MRFLQRTLLRYRPTIVGAALFFAAATASANTVMFVTVFTDDLPVDGVSKNQSFEMSVSDSRISGFRMPFVEGRLHTVTILGNLTDLLDRVEITEGSRVIRTISKSGLDNVSRVSAHGGKGQIRFKIHPSHLPDVGNDFQIRIRFAVEMAGYDKLDCKVVRRGTITKMEWKTNNGARLPNVALAAPQKTSLTADGIYHLHLTGDGFASSTQVNDGVQKHVLDQPVTSFAQSTTALDVTFTYNNIRRNTAGDVVFETSDMNFADAGAGNIDGGWGPYIYYRIKSPLPAPSKSSPAVTDLKGLCLDCVVLGTSAPVNTFDVARTPTKVKRP